VTAILYTPFETAKLAEIDPQRYAFEATRHAVLAAGTVTLPGDLA